MTTCIGIGSSYTFDDQVEYKGNKDQYKFVDFLSLSEVHEFCTKHKIMSASKQCITGHEECIKFLNIINENRDVMTLKKCEELLKELNVEVKYGLVDHNEVLGDTLEGFVLFLNHKNILKFKFPNYTIRTMMLRSLFKKMDKSIEDEFK